MIPKYRHRCKPYSPCSNFAQTALLNPHSNPYSYSCFVQSAPIAKPTDPKRVPNEWEKLLKPLGFQELAETVNGFTPNRLLKLLELPIEPSTALDAFNWAARQKGFIHNGATYHAIIKKMGESGDFAEVHRLLWRMKSEECFCSEFTFILIMRCYGKARLPGQAARVLNLMYDFDCKPSTKSFNVVLDILVSSQCYKMAQSVYFGMLRARVSPTAFTFGVIIKSFCRTNQVDFACNLLREMPKHGCVPDRKSVV